MSLSTNQPKLTMQTQTPPNTPHRHAIPPTSAQSTPLPAPSTSHQIPLTLRFPNNRLLDVTEEQEEVIRDWLENSIILPGCMIDFRNRYDLSRGEVDRSHGTGKRSVNEVDVEEEEDVDEYLVAGGRKGVQQEMELGRAAPEFIEEEEEEEEEEDQQDIVDIASEAISTIHHQASSLAFPSLATAKALVPDAAASSSPNPAPRSRSSTLSRWSTRSRSSSVEDTGIADALARPTRGRSSVEVFSTPPPALRPSTSSSPVITGMTRPVVDLTKPARHNELTFHTDPNPIDLTTPPKPIDLTTPPPLSQSETRLFNPPPSTENDFMDLDPLQLDSTALNGFEDSNSEEQRIRAEKERGKERGRSTKRKSALEENIGKGSASGGAPAGRRRNSKDAKRRKTANAGTGTTDESDLSDDYGDAKSTKGAKTKAKAKSKSREEVKVREKAKSKVKWAKVKSTGGLARGINQGEGEFDQEGAEEDEYDDNEFRLMGDAYVSRAHRSAMAVLISELCIGDLSQLGKDVLVLRDAIGYAEVPFPTLEEVQAGVTLEYRKEPHYLQVNRLTRSTIIGEAQVHATQLWQVINHISLARMVHRIKAQSVREYRPDGSYWENPHKRRTSTEAIWEACVRGPAGTDKTALCSLNKFRAWIRNGTKWSQLGLAATVNLFVLIILKGQKNKVDKLNMEIIDALACAIRDPRKWLTNDAFTLGLVEDSLIPMLGKIDKILQLTPSNSGLEEHMEMDCWMIQPGDPCLERWEMVFGQVETNTFSMVPRDMDVWCKYFTWDFPQEHLQDFEGEADVDMQDEGGDQVTLPSRQPTSIVSRYERDSPGNVTKPYPENSDERWVWDKREREKAEGALEIDGVDQLTDEMQSKERFPEGVRNWDASYIKLVEDRIRELERIELLDPHGKLLAYVIGNLPPWLRRNLHGGLKNCMAPYLEDELEARDTRKEQSETGYPNSYAVIHFDHWIRYATKGHKAPKGVHPRFLCRINKRRFNYNQLLAWPCRESVEHQELHESLKTIFCPVFAWIAKQIKELMPEWYEQLTWCLEILPYNEDTAAAPFLGFVLNMNVLTKSHRDGKDLSACVVMPIGDFEGGELVLAELGLVLELKNGDIVIFPSTLITHFNLHYTGNRASFVFHTDISALKFSKDRNGWKFR